MIPPGTVRALARRAVGLQVESTAIDDPDPSALIRFLQANRIPLEEALEELPRDGRIRTALEREASTRRELLDAFVAVRSTLGERGIRGVLFKSPLSFPFMSSNLDLLVEPCRFHESARILGELGHIQLPHYREDHKLLYRTFLGGAPSLSVHLHEMVSWGKVRILEGADVVTRAVPGREEGILVSSPGDCLATTIAHSVLETDQIRLNDLRTVALCLREGASVPGLLDSAREARWSVAAAAGLLLYDGVHRHFTGAGLLTGEDRQAARDSLSDRPGVARAVARMLNREKSRLPFSLPRLLAKRHALRVILSDERRDLDQRLLDLGATGWNLAATRMGIRARPASLVTISGPDGSGKSEVAGSVHEMLALCEVPTRRIWSRGGFSRLAVAGKALARRAAPGAIPGTADERGKRTFLGSPWRSVLWTWAVVLEQALALQRIRIHLALGRTVICDRYVYDSLADITARLAGRNGGGLSLRASGFLLGTVPRPDLALLIQVRPETAHSRKPDGATLESRRDLAAAYEVVSRWAPFTRIDGERGPREVKQEAVERTLRRCLRRFRGGGC